MGVGTWPKMVAGEKNQREPPKWDFLSQKTKGSSKIGLFSSDFSFFDFKSSPPLLSEPLCTKSQPHEPTCLISQFFFFTWWTYMFKFSTKFLNYHGKSQILEKIHLLKSNLLHLSSPCSFRGPIGGFINLFHVEEGGISYHSPTGLGEIRTPEYSKIGWILICTFMYEVLDPFSDINNQTFEKSPVYVLFFPQT